MEYVINIFSQKMEKVKNNGRHHSCAVSFSPPGQTPDTDRRRISGRRSSLADNLDSLTRSMSSTLNLLQRRTSQDNQEPELQVDKIVIQTALCRFYRDNTIKVGK